MSSDQVTTWPTTGTVTVSRPPVMFKQDQYQTPGKLEPLSEVRRLRWSNVHTHTPAGNTSHLHQDWLTDWHWTQERESGALVWNGEVVRYNTRSRSWRAWSCEAALPPPARPAGTGYTGTHWPLCTVTLSMECVGLVVSFAAQHHITSWHPAYQSLVTMFYVLLS